MSRRLPLAPAPQDSSGDTEPLPPRRLDLDALLIPFQRPAPAVEAPLDRPAAS